MEVVAGTKAVAGAMVEMVTGTVANPRSLVVRGFRPLPDVGSVSEHCRIPKTIPIEAL